jgi:hypothetical protein
MPEGGRNNRASVYFGIHCATGHCKPRRANRSQSTVNGPQLALQIEHALSSYFGSDAVGPVRKLGASRWHRDLYWD